MRLLLVEDEHILAMARSRELERQGLAVRVSHSGEEAVDAALSDPSIELVLMDVELGRGIDGPEAARHILQQRSLPVIFLTSQTEREFVHRARGVTSYGYVRKHANSGVLLSAIDLALNMFHASQRLARPHRGPDPGPTLTGEIIERADEEGRWSFLNTVGFDVFGLTDAEARGARFIDFVHSEDRDKTIESGRYMAETLEPVYGLTNRQWTGSGWRLFEWNSTPLVGPDGRFAGHQGTGRDITDE